MCLPPPEFSKHQKQTGTDIVKNVQQQVSGRRYMLKKLYCFAVVKKKKKKKRKKKKIAENRLDRLELTVSVNFWTNLMITKEVDGEFV